MGFVGKIYDDIKRRLGVDQLPSMDVLLVKMVESTEDVLAAVGTVDNPLHTTNPAISGNAEKVILTDEYGFEAELSPIGEQRVVEPTSLVGTQFEGSTLDSNFWGNAVANGGGVAQSGAQVSLTTSANANGSAKLYSIRRGRYVGGVPMRFRSVVQVVAGVADNKRRWGVAFGASMPTITDGAWFQLDGTEFSVVVMKGSSETKVTSFNGDLGASYSPGTNANTYEIYWTNMRLWFVVNGAILHTVTSLAATWSNTMNHYIFMDNVNSGNTSDITLQCRVASIYRLGDIETQPTSVFQSGTTAGLVLKYGPGNLHGVVISAVSNNARVILYNNTAASGGILLDTGSMGALTTPFDIEFHNKPFSMGLTLVISGANANVDVIYE